MAQDNSRTKSSMINLIFALGGRLLNIITKFGVRTVFISALGKEYLGLNGLFTNILSFLSLAELGVGASIVFSLYKPIAEDNRDKIIVLMRLYKRAYTFIGIIVLAIGTGLTPFLNFFISDMPDIPNIQLIYLLFVLNSGISYFYSYKAAFIAANQKNYIVTNNTYIFELATAIMQIVLLILFRNYFAYLFTQVFFTILSNITISAIADKKYPILRETTKSRLDKETRSIIATNVGAAFFHRIGHIIVFCTDNILLSKFFGLLVVGLYSNYSMIITSVEGILSQFFTAITASVGNLGATASEDRQREVYGKIFFIQFWIYSLATAALAVSINPFIDLWLGKDYIMSTKCVIFIVMNFYLKGMRQVNMTFNSAYGLARYYKWMPIPESIANIVFSILAANLIGPEGIFIGTTLSTLAAPFWIEPYILMKYGLQGSLTRYYWMYIKYFATTFGMTAFSLLCASMIPFSGIMAFLVNILIVLLLPNIMIYLLFGRSPEFKYLVCLMKEFKTKIKIKLSERGLNHDQITKKNI